MDIHLCATCDVFFDCHGKDEDAKTCLCDKIHIAAANGTITTVFACSDLCVIAFKLEGFSDLGYLTQEESDEEESGEDTEEEPMPTKEETTSKKKEDAELK